MKSCCKNKCVSHTAGINTEDRNPEYPEIQQLKEHIRRLERELFHIWGYIGQEGLWNEAREYVDEHAGEAIPFELIL